MSTTVGAPTSQTDYDALCKKLKDISSLGEISGLLGWDELVLMQPGSAESRSRQKATLAAIIHERSTDPSLGTLLKTLNASPNAATLLGPYEHAVIREASRQYRKATAVTEELVRREAELESRGYAAWIEARTSKDFSKFSTVLREWINARKERAAFIDNSKPTYDVLADDYSSGLTAARLDEIFSRIKQELVPFLADLRARGTPPDASWLKTEIDVDTQAEFCKNIAIAIGFDTTKGRLDVSVHPFSGGAGPQDIRMTTRYKRNDFIEGLTGTIHETGHSIYEQGRNTMYAGLPVSTAAGMAIHESQSLLWERMVGLSLPFAKYLLPKLHETFPGSFPDDKTPEDLYAALNVVRDPSFIRVESDELTYIFHVILRYEIERALVEGTMDIEDIPVVWNQKMKEYLGVEPEDDSSGCLQDVHWSCGAIGYFPTYSLGAMAAVQIFQAAKRDIPDLDDRIEKGEFRPLKEWLNTKVHQVGSLFENDDQLLQHVTGSVLDPGVFIEYIKEKYTKLYAM